MENIIHGIISTYYFAIFAIVFGIWKLNDTIKNTTRDTNSALQPFMSGIAGKFFKQFGWTAALAVPLILWESGLVALI